MPLASLTVDLRIGLAQLQADCAAAQNLIGATLQKVGAGVGTVVGTIAGIGTVAATGAVGLAVLADREIKAIAGLKDLADRSGIAVAELARFQTVSATSGVSLDKFADLAAKLQSTLTITRDDSSRAGAAIKALGINLGELKSQAPDQQFVTIARALAGFADGGGRSAVAIALLGREGAKAIPFLNDLAELGKSQVRLTQDQIEAADAYAKAQAKTRSELQQLGQVAAIQVLPSIVAFEGALRDAAAAVLGLDASGQRLASSTAVADFAKSTARAIGFLVDSGDGVARTFEVAGKSIAGYAAVTAALLRGSVSEAKAAGASAREDIEAALQRPLFSAQLEARLNAPAPTKVEDTRPALDFKLPDLKALAAAQREAAQVLRQQLDADLKFVRDRLQEERDGIGNQQAELQALYSAGELSVVQFYDRKAAAVGSGVQKELNALTDEQARLEVELARTSDPSDRIKLQSQASEAAEKAARIERQAASDARVAATERGTALRNLADQVASYRAELQQLEGDELGAARARAALTVQQSQRLSTLSGGAISSDDIARQARALDLANSFADAQRRISVAGADAARAEEAYRLRASRGGADLFEQEAAVYQIRATSLVQLGELTEKARALADASSDPRLVQQAADLELAYAKAADSVDPALNRIRAGADELAGSFRNVFDTIFDGSATGADALKNLQKAVLSTLSKTFISDPLETALKSGLQGVLNGDSGIGRFFRFGTPSAANARGDGINVAGSGYSAAKDSQSASEAFDALQGGLSGVVSATVTQTTVTQAASSALITMTTAAQAAAQALAAVANSSGGSLFKGFDISGGGGFGTGANYGNQDLGAFLADGTNYVPYDGFRAVLHKGESVTPAKYNPAAGGWGAGGSRGPDQIQIIHQGVPMTATRTETSQGPDGGTIKKIFTQSLQEEVGSGGPGSEVMQRKFGLKRQNARRG